MGLFEMIFGQTPNTQADIFDSRTQGLANQAFNNAYAQQQAMNQNQLANAYNQQLMNQYQMYRNQPKWVYNGIDCTVQEFAELMWPDDEQARLMFILKHGGV
jgi:hypothetical protein